ncbi:unnamed protein product, partial [Didymodactylos carnosus]
TTLLRQQHPNVVLPSEHVYENTSEKSEKDDNLPHSIPNDDLHSYETVATLLQHRIDGIPNDDVSKDGAKPLNTSINGISDSYKTVGALLNQPHPGIELEIQKEHEISNSVPIDEISSEDARVIEKDENIINKSSFAPVEFEKTPFLAMHPAGRIGDAQNNVEPQESKSLIETGTEQVKSILAPLGDLYSKLRGSTDEKVITENDNVKENETGENRSLFAPLLSVHKPQATPSDSETTDAAGAAQKESSGTAKLEIVNDNNQLE